MTNGHEPSEASSEAPTVDAGSARADASVAAPVWLDAGEKDPVEFASGLDGLFLDVPCTGDTATPLAKGATCAHVAMTQRIERKLQFGGEPGRVYRVRLRVRGIWEPTSIVGGTRPVQELPYTVGGTVATGAGDPINYQQYFIRISEPRQVYWLNDYRYVAHDIHKEDYELELQITAGADVTVGMNDGNDHQIANWTRDLFQGLAPYATKPSTGQLLRLDVLAVDPL